MSKNIVVLSGSPRKNGNTEKLTAAFIVGAESAGKNVTLFRVSDMKIGGCIGCRVCFSNKSACVLNDDMTQIVDALRKADVLVFTSPVYFFSVSAQLKAAIDRTFVLLKDKPPIKKAALLLTCGDESLSAAAGAVVTYNQIRDYMKWHDAGVIIATGLHDPDEIDGRCELNMASALGREI